MLWHMIIHMRLECEICLVTVPYLASVWFNGQVGEVFGCLESPPNWDINGGTGDNWWGGITWGAATHISIPPAFLGTHDLGP